MKSKLLLRKSKKHTAEKRSQRNVINKIVEDDFIRRASVEEYRDKVRDVYDGPQGALLATCSFISLHLTFGERLIRERKFDVRGARHILDVGSGAGQIAKHLLKYSDPGARLTCFDLSLPMVRRGRNRIKNDQPDHLVADVTHLPFADGTFDCVTCGYVIEHLPDARLGLAELARVMQRGGRLLLLVSEDTFSGAFTSRLWCCRTYNRRELRELCHSVGLVWKEELWFTRMHKALRAGGICVEIVKS
ncbi:MAG TPA: class I SAM-dependent methyltransferase [Pirellulales bacterium]